MMELKGSQALVVPAKMTLATHKSGKIFLSQKVSGIIKLSAM